MTTAIDALAIGGDGGYAVPVGIRIDNFDWGEDPGNAEEIETIRQSIEMLARQRSDTR
jgi:hypothetical protein